MKKNVRKMLSLMCECGEADQFILENHPWMSDEVIQGFIDIFQKGKQERIKKENRIKSLFLKLS